MISNITWQTDAIKYLEPIIYRFIYNAISPKHENVALLYEITPHAVVIHTSVYDSIISYVVVFDDYEKSGKSIAALITSVVAKYLKGDDHE